MTPSSGWRQRAAYAGAALLFATAGCTSSGNGHVSAPTTSPRVPPSSSTTSPSPRALWQLTSAPCPPGGNHVRTPTPVVAVVAVDECNLFVAAGPTIWLVSRGTAEQAWTVPTGYDTAAIAYVDGRLWWAGDGTSGSRVLTVDPVTGTTRDVALGDGAAEVVALWTWGDRLLVGMTVDNAHSSVASVNGARLERLLERPGRITGLAGDDTTLAATFSTQDATTLVWGRPQALHEHTWPGPANVIDLAISGPNIAFGLSRLNSEQIPQGSEIPTSRDQGRHWSTLDLGNDELASLAFAGSQLWLSKSGRTGVSVYTAAANGRLKHVGAAGSSDQPLRLLPTTGGVWVVGSDVAFLSGQR